MFIIKRLLLAGLLTAFAAVTALADPVRVGSKIDTEGALLGNMILFVLGDAGVPVEDKTELGPTNIVRQAIITGQIDIYPEYTGNGAYLFKDADKAAYKNWEKGYADVKQLDYLHNKIVWLTPSPANNTWAIAVTGRFSEKNKINTLEDMADYVKGGGKVKIAVSEEFATRPDTLPAFQKAYGFKLSDNQLIILSGGNTAQTEQALAQGTSGVNFAMAYGTDGAIAALGLKILEDTKEVQPVYAPVPIVRESVLKQYPQIKERLSEVFQTLDMATLQRLNAQIAVNGVPAGKVAKSYLKNMDFIK
ncbi:Substrate-binding region of ABC-type glycine betaine transport system [Denitrovibrio acetiphilus DSM 12809]|uniref:Substrate-binding region of ABC-type glycine betaine transport system n=1 Tax=Denitrovibrio acetiphilus (strain DSM 12809 / NBRC 114555 / N2460) TaxID=522772 RepID=D4H3U7_DENA2|nr:ABC transporter substrate-binding protein [Denitrovibrio acetiphilus]ADD69199.1 Substrate-binding region of ABC-type glycine betaine transport system [Denitrovibrio acetiphilus DSM 12809]